MSYEIIVDKMTGRQIGNICFKSSKLYEVNLINNHIKNSTFSRLIKKCIIKYEKRVSKEMFFLSLK